VENCFLNLLLRLNQSDGHITGTMTPANSWRLFVPRYVPVLVRFQPRCRNRPDVRLEKRPSAVSVRMAHLVSRRTHFHEILYWEIFTKIRLRRIVWPKRDEVTGSGENFIVSSFMICIPHSLLCG
jgi:hypothetical protein